MNYIEEIHGDGVSILSYLKNIFFNKVSVQTEKALKDYDGYYVSNIVIYRTPIQSILKTILNGLTFGQFLKNVKENYDDVFHLYAIFHLTKKGFPDQYALTEKTPNIVWEKRMGLASGQSNTKAYPIPLAREEPVLFTQMIMRSMERDKDNFNRYTASDFNCQQYILSLITSIYEPKPVSDGITKFVYQDPQILFNGINEAAVLANSVTSLGHLVGRVTGKGLY